jgi:hypothetical protein
LIIVTVLNEQIVARLDQAQDFVQSPRADRTSKRFAGFGVIGDGDAGPEKPRQHLSPTAVWFQRLITNRRISEQEDRRDFRWNDF